MKKGLIVILIVILIIGGIFTFAWIWFDGLKDDSAFTKVKMDEVLEAYPKFNKEVDNFSALRNQLYEYKDGLYLETFRDNADVWNNFMNDYKTLSREDYRTQGLTESDDLLRRFYYQNNDLTPDSNQELNEMMQDGEQQDNVSNEKGLGGK